VAENLDEYTRRLEDALARLVERFDKIPFPVVVRAFSGHGVVRLEETDDADRGLLEVLVRAAELAGRRAQADGIESKRANEVGNRIEPYVRDAFNEVGREAGLHADIPETAAGGQQAVGYPDLEINDGMGRRTYLEVKTYNIANIDTTQRAFYLSPPLSKVTADARHLILSFQIVEVRTHIYKPEHWRIYDAHDMVGQIKNEFNATNRQMYGGGRLLADGEL
jgi:hypothetical protein